MKYAFLSDIHANRQALKAVLQDIRSIGVDQIVCLGDLVGYGPSPAETLEIAYANIHNFILGNHDAVVAGLLQADCFNSNARRIIDWTVENLDGKASEFFKNLPLAIRCHEHDFRCVHGEFSDPGSFGYIFESHEALASFRACDETLLFSGHSHVPGFYVMGKDEDPSWNTPQDLFLENEYRYIVNVGSVGQPRDNDPRASYCVYDTESRKVVFRRIPFDIDSFKDDLRAAELPEESSCFLKFDKEQTAPALREIIEFKPVSSEKSVKTACEVQDLAATVKSLRRQKTIMLFVLLFLMGLSVFLFFTKKTPPEKKNLFETYPAREASLSLIPEDVNSGDELILMPKVTGEIAKDRRMRLWTAKLSDPLRQNISVESQKDKKGNRQVFRIKSGSPKEILIEYVPINANSGNRFNISAWFKKIKIESGFVRLVLKYSYANGTEKTLLSCEPKNLINSKAWKKASSTQSKNDILNESGQIKFIIQAKFTGELLVRRCSMKNKIK